MEIDLRVQYEFDIAILTLNRNILIQNAEFGI